MFWGNFCTQSHGVTCHKIGVFILTCVRTANFNFGTFSYFRIRYRFEHVSTAKLSFEHVSTAKLSFEQVSTAKLSFEHVSTAKLSFEHVSTAKLSYWLKFLNERCEVKWGQISRHSPKWFECQFCMNAILVKSGNSGHIKFLDVCSYIVRLYSEHPLISFR
jgi:hypothetical protein